MSQLSIRNLSYIRSMKPDDPQMGSRLYEALQDLITHDRNLASQTNANPQGPSQPPPAVNGVQVSAQNGFMHVAITDNNEVYRGIRYYAVHSLSNQFSNPQIVPMGDSRNVTIAIGNQTRHVGVYSSYLNSPPSPMVIHGGSTPIPVSGGGSDAGPLFLDGQGSGTGSSGVAHSGPGPIAFRSKTGSPPIR
jgi:hypothetical protein